MANGFSFQRTASVARKEFIHIFRDPATLFFALFIPILQLLMLGFAIDTNVRYIRTAVLDLAQTEESRRLLRRFENSTTFRLRDSHVRNDEELSQALISGRARVGIKIPANYSERVLRGNEPAQVLILVDGSDSSVASSALNVASAIITQEAVDLAKEYPNNQPRVVAAPQIKFNPSTRSPNFFIPGLMVVLSQMMAVMLSANAIVREKENGTLEQLFMTPVRSGELIFGKLAPYLVLTFLEFCMILALMRIIFQVPIHGPVGVLLFLALPFVFCFLGLGLWFSTRVSTREAASQMAMGTMMPSIFLSGYIFPLDSMPAFFWYIAQAIPTTWMIDASRGVILRGATMQELWLNAIVLWAMGLTIFALSMLTFRKQL